MYFKMLFARIGHVTSTISHRIRDDAEDLLLPGRIRQPLAFGGGPITESFIVFFRQSRLWMHRHVGAERHVPVFYFVANLPQFAVLAVSRQFSPFRIVEVAASIGDVVCKPPGYGSDIRVPGPDGLV